VATPWSYYFVRGGAIVVVGICASQWVAPGALAVGMAKGFISVKAMVTPGVVIPVLVELVVPGSVVPNLVPAVIPLVDVSTNLTSSLLNLIFEMGAWERALDVMDINGREPWCMNIRSALQHLNAFYTVGLHFPSIYTLDAVPGCLEEVFKHAKTIASLFNDAQLSESNSLSEPLMDYKSFCLSHSVKALCGKIPSRIKDFMYSKSD
jgi:hypothetical protein